MVTTGQCEGESRMSGSSVGSSSRFARAGRDLPAAIAVGVVLGVGVVAALLTVRFLFLVILAAAVAVSTWEFSGALRRGADIRVARVPVLLGGQVMIWSTWQLGLRGVLVSFAITVLFCLVWRFRGGAEGYLRDTAASVFTMAYVPLFAAFAGLLLRPEDGAWRVLCFMIGVVVSDTAGYGFGVWLGRHPMAPTVSPKKSWEGFGGSMLGGLIAGGLSVTLLLGGEWWEGLLFGAAVVCSATAGDLMESLMKRDLGIKDMGTLLPGHGGLMDRMDSLLPTAAVAWMVLYWLVPS